MNDQSGSPAPVPVAQASGAIASPSIAYSPDPFGKEAGFSVRRFKVEAAGLLLILLTLAAIQFQDLFTSSQITLRPDKLGQYLPYAFGDDTMGGHSTIDTDLTRPFVWSCELRPGYDYPFCGYGITFDPNQQNKGADLTKFQHVAIRLRFEGPTTKLRFVLKNRAAGLPYSADPTPGEVSFPVKQGLQTIELDLDEFGTPAWWLLKTHAATSAAVPRSNVVAIELMPGEGARLGAYHYSIESLTIEGKQFSQAQFYLAVLAIWSLLLTIFLAWRVLGIRRLFESRHQRQLRESRELQFARAVAERASAAKSAFLANMSHELRTPLNAILGYAQLLEQRNLGDQENVAARTIRQSGTHLLTLITDILDLSKIEAGRLELEPSPFDLPLCITGVADMMRIRAAEKGVEFVCAIGAGVPRHVIGDEKRLRQVLINLLGNAIKFTQRGEVALRIAALGARDGATAVRIEVCDTGVGMRETELSRIFEPFEQVGTATSRAGGTGLGLSISRRIVDLMGGTIHVDSTEGQGSRFWFEIALRHAESLLTAETAKIELAAPAEAVAAPVEEALVSPSPEQLEALLKLARAGNMRAIRAFADKIAAEQAELGPFAERLRTLAAGFQSPAILDLVARCSEARKAAA